MTKKLHYFAAFMAIICLITLPLRGMPENWADYVAISIGIPGAYVFFFCVGKFFVEKCEEYGVWGHGAKAQR